MSLTYAVTAGPAAMEIEKATLSFNEIPLTISGRIFDYPGEPKVDLKLVVPPLAVDQALAKIPSELTSSLAELQPAGEIGAEFNLSGRLEETDKLLQSGEIRLAPLSMMVSGTPAVLSGTLRMKGDTLQSENLQLQMAENRADIDLRIDNLLGEIKQVKSTFKAERFALDPLLQGSAVPAAAVTPTRKEEVLFPLAIPVDAQGKVTIGETLYKGLVIRDFVLDYRLQDNILTVQDLRGEVAQGRFAGSARSDLGKKVPAIACKIEFARDSGRSPVNGLFPPGRRYGFRHDGPAGLYAGSRRRGTDAEKECICRRKDSVD